MTLLSRMDTYFKKEIVYPFEEKKYVFDIGETLFSTFDIDHGTDILIRSVSPTKSPTTIILDFFSNSRLANKTKIITLSKILAVTSTKKYVTR